MDASNYTGALTDQGCAELKTAGIVGVIIQAIIGNDGTSYTTQQLDACTRNGLRIQGYVWCFPGASKGGMAQRLFMFEGYNLEALWLDVEQAGLKIADVNRDLVLCDQYMGGRKTGLYTARWFFAQQGWLGLTKWSDRPLWTATYDGIADINISFTSYGGWAKPTIKQYRGSASIGSVHQIDLDVMG